MELGKVYILKGFSRVIVGFDVQWRWISLWNVLSWKLLYQGKLFCYFIFRPWTSVLGWDLLVSLWKSWVFSVTVPKKGNITNETFSIGINFYVGLGLFQSPPCRYLQRTLLFLCLMQLHGFDDNCFHWTQISFLSLRIRPSISWVGPGYNYTESSSSHQCVPIISCHLICSNCFYLQQIFFFVRCNYFLFASTTFYLQQLYFVLQQLFICSDCPLWHGPLY